jgi:glycosyltransferase involved in cell wall biosynthesis
MSTEPKMYIKPNNQIRVLMISRQFSPFIGGTEIQAQKLARKLIEYGVKVLMTTSWWIWGTPQQETIDTIPVFRNFAFWGMFGIKGLRKFGEYTYLVTLLSYLWRHRNEYDLIHIHLLNQAAFSGVLAGRWLKKPTIIKLAASGLYSDIYKMQTSNFALPGSKQMLPIILKANRFVAINGEIVDELWEAGVPKERILFIPNGIEMDKFGIKTDYGLQDPIRLVFVGRLHHQKGLDVLLQALSDIITSQSKFRWRLLLIGDGPLQHELREMARQLGVDREVEFGGFVNNVPSYLNTADIFLLPSRSEGLSNALLEAMACGLPCVATSVSGNVDLIRHFETGILVPPNDSTALADAIISLTEEESLRRRLGQAAHETVGAMYNLDSVAARYIELYDSLLKEQ